MDVLCVGMYRACSTWQYEVAAHLVERHRRGRRLGYVPGDEYDGHEAGHAAPRRWRVLKSHEGHRRFAVALKAGHARGIYAHRDVRDVVYSLMHKRALGFDDLIRRGMLHQIHANHRFWTRQKGLLVQRYEDLVADPASGIEELAGYLGIALEDGESGRIAEEYSFEKNRRRARNLRRQLSESCRDLDDPNVAQVYDARTLLHWNHIRDGRNGGWRERATPRQRKVLATLSGGWLVDHGYEPDHSWRDASLTADPARPGRLDADVVRGEIACLLRGLSAEFPRLATMAKRIFRVRNVAPAARVARPPATDRLQARRRGERQLDPVMAADGHGDVANASSCC